MFTERAVDLKELERMTDLFLSGMVNNGNDCSCSFCQGPIGSDCLEVKAGRGTGFWLPGMVGHHPFAKKEVSNSSALRITLGSFKNSQSPVCTPDS